MVEKHKFYVNPDIRVAETLDKSFYTDLAIYESSITSIFCNSWLYVADLPTMLKQPENVFPFDLLEYSLQQPIILIKEGDQVKILSNVCTHRGFKIIHHPTKSRNLVCGYHGRQFTLDGAFKSMPEFEEAINFPRHCDSLPQVEHFVYKRFVFGGLSPKMDAKQLSEILDQRIGHMNMSAWRFAPECTKSYSVNAHWALYCENYLEGFHIPFVHAGLNSIVDYGQYRTEIYDHAVLQIGYGKSGEDTLKLPDGHIDQGRNVTAYYYWLFPNFMLNIYAWGVQINIVRPVRHDMCKVEFLYYIADENLWQKFGKDSFAEKVEREDEYVVESVQKGLLSQLYQKGRFSPSREKGVHYFQNLLSDYLLG